MPSTDTATASVQVTPTPADPVAAAITSQVSSSSTIMPTKPVVLVGGNEGKEAGEEEATGQDLRATTVAGGATPASALTGPVPTAPVAEDKVAGLDEPSPTPSATILDHSNESSSVPIASTVPPKAAPATSTPRSAQAVATVMKKKKTRSPLAAFFMACVPCISSSSHSEDLAPSPSTTEKKAIPVSSPPTTSTAVVSEKVVEEAEETTTNVPAIIVPVAVIAAGAAAVVGGAGVALSQEETEGVTSGAVMPPGKGRRRRSGKQPESIITSVPEPGMGYGRREEDDSEEDSEDEDSEEDEEQSLIARGGVGIPIGEDGLPHPLLDELAPELKGRKCLVLDLDETLVHSSFKQMVHQADYVVPVEIENQYHNVYVIKRPGVDAFLKAMGEIYEVVIFTASLSKYADPVLDQLDIHRVVKHRLFRESCYNNKGNYVKDLSQLGRSMADCIIIDNSPASYVFHPNNAVPISSWFNDPHDTELTDLVPFLTDLEKVDDIRSVLDAGLYQHLA